MKAKVSDSVVSKVGLPKALIGVWGETARCLLIGIGSLECMRQESLGGLERQVFYVGSLVACRW